MFRTKVVLLSNDTLLHQYRIVHLAALTLVFTESVCTKRRLNVPLLKTNKQTINILQTTKEQFKWPSRLLKILSSPLEERIKQVVTNIMTKLFKVVLLQLR